MIQQFGKGNILKMSKKLGNIGNIFHLFLYFFQISAGTHAFKFGGILLAELSGN